MLPFAAPDRGVSVEGEAEVRHVQEEAENVRGNGANGLEALLAGKIGEGEKVSCDFVFNINYSFQVLVEIENREFTELSPIENITSVAKRRKKDAPSPIALEPCSGNRAAVLSLLVRLPTGEGIYKIHG